MEECSNGTATDCLTQLETIWNMTQCGRKLLSGSNAAAEGASGVSDRKTGNSGSAVSGNSLLPANNAEEESSDESNSQGSSSKTASPTNSLGQDSIGTWIGRKRRQVLGSNREGSFGFSSRGSFGSNSFRNQPAAVDAEYEFLAIYMGLPESERKAIGHDFEGMFKSCIFEGVDCLDGR